MEFWYKAQESQSSIVRRSGIAHTNSVRRAWRTFELDGAVRIREDQTLFRSDNRRCPTSKSESAPTTKSKSPSVHRTTNRTQSFSARTRKTTDLATLAFDHLTASRSRSLCAMTFSNHTLSVTAASRCQEAAGESARSFVV